MSIDEAKGANLVFVNPLDIVQFLIKVPTAVAIALRKSVFLKCRPNLEHFVPI